MSLTFGVIDYETFFDPKTYTLSSMSTESYIRDPRFEAHGAAIKWSPSVPARWYPEKELRQVLAEEDWSQYFLISHHANFDHLILSHHYGIHPKMSGCTLAMSKLLIGNHLSVSLDNVRKHFEMPLKTTPYNLFAGKHWHELSPAVQQMMADGACDEAESIWEIFKLLMKEFPVEELEVVDITTKMFSAPTLRGDVDMLAKVWEREVQGKQQRLAALNIAKEDLQSSDRFAALLRCEGVEPEFKPSPADPQRSIYAFAKTDQFMRDLLEDDNERVRTLVEARLGQKSTLMQTRAETLGYMATRGAMPVYLRYCGAHTTRWSGGDGANWQNFKRGSDIRKAIMAPEGYLLAPIDLSQIEYRILCWLAGEEEALDELKRGDDPYCDLASEVYGFKVTKNHPGQRGTGKQLKLSCGFQAGAKTIQATARLGIYGPPVTIDIAEAERWKNIYRKRMARTVAYWGEAGRMIARIAGGDPLPWGPMLIRDKKVYGPGGTHIDYTTLEYHRPTEEECAKLPEFNWGGFWRFRTRNGWTSLYSGKLVENLVQWLARIVMSQAMVRIARRGYRVVNTTHDELLILIKKDGNEARHLQECEDEMRREPTWLPGIPLDCEGSLSERYEK